MDVAVVVAQLVVIAAVAIVPVWRNRHYRRETREKWQVVADKLGLDLSYEFDRPRIEGRVDGVQVDLKASDADYSDTSRRWSFRVVARLPDNSLPPFRVMRRDDHPPFGKKRVDTGDPEFEAELLLAGSVVRASHVVLSTEQRAEILRLYRAYPKIEVSNDGLALTLRGSSQTAQEMIELTRRLIRSARTFGPPR